MKTIQTKPDCTLGFVEEAHIRHYMIFPEKGDSSWRPPTIIGKLSEITEDQAKELVEVKGPKVIYLKNGFPLFIQAVKKIDIHLLIGEDDIISSSHGLKTLAKIIAGIEEKDFEKYLVVKL